MWSYGNARKIVLSYQEFVATMLPLAIPALAKGYFKIQEHLIHRCYLKDILKIFANEYLQ